eukprot:8496011-Lingulodinium_polyedra.AAC.1
MVTAPVGVLGRPRLTKGPRRVLDGLVTVSRPRLTTVLSGRSLPPQPSRKGRVGSRRLTVAP